MQFAAVGVLKGAQVKQVPVPGLPLSWDLCGNETYLMVQSGRSVSSKMLS